MLATLLLIGLLVWIDRGAPRPRVYAVVAACVAAVLPALIPYERFLQLKVRSDTLMIVPLWNVQDEVGLPRLDDVVLLGGIVAAALFLLVPRRYLLALPAVVLAYFVIAIQPIQAGPHGMEQAAAGALFEGIRTGSAMDRRGRRRRRRRRALDGEDESLHRAHERVLQPLGRPRLHARRADAGRPAGDGRRVDPRPARSAASPTAASSRRATSSPTARSPSTATRSPPTSCSGSTLYGVGGPLDLDDERDRRLQRLLVRPRGLRTGASAAAAGRSGHARERSRARSRSRRRSLATRRGRRRLAVEAPSSRTRT